MVVTGKTESWARVTYHRAKTKLPFEDMGMTDRMLEKAASEIKKCRTERLMKMKLNPRPAERIGRSGSLGNS